MAEYYLQVRLTTDERRTLDRVKDATGKTLTRIVRELIHSLDESLPSHVTSDSTPTTPRAR